MFNSKIVVGISSCLLGDEVRYNGGHKNNSYISKTLSEYFHFQKICPEVGAGLGVPRPPIRLVATDKDTVRALGVDDPDMDVTDQLVEYSRSQFETIAELSGYILKRASPSCGMERVKVYTTKGIPVNSGTGIFAGQLQEHFPYLPVEEEGRLGDPRLRENFIERVYCYKRWQIMLEQGVSVQALTDFHARHKLILMSRHQQHVPDLGRLAASANKDNLDQVLVEYRDKFMASLKKLATRKNHANVLMHAMGYLKQELDSDDKKELLESIEEYRLGFVPLIVPITLLKHHFRRQPDPYIDRSWYFSPFPSELKLRNAV